MSEISDVEPAVLDPALAPSLRSGERTTILIYCGLLIFGLNMITPASGFQVIPLSFILKNKLHLSASQLAIFSSVAAIPAYLSFVFGMVRDSWSPFGMGDRGYLVLFGGGCAAFFALFAFLPVSEPMLLAAVLLTTMTFLFTWSAWNGLGSVIGQQLAMSGQISALWNVLASIAIFAATMIGGVYSESLERFDAQTSIRILFLSMTASMAAIALLGVWKPNAVYRHLHREEGPRPNMLADLARLGRHWPIYPALGAWLLWNFSPGGATVLQYYMADKLGATDAQWGEYNAIFYLAFLPTFALFGFLSRRYSLSALLWWGTIVAIPQMVPVLFVHTPGALMLVAVPMGLMGGVANAAYMDLLIRSCPKGLEGTMMMMAWSMYAVAVNFGNVLGTSLYEWGGMFLCIAATTVVYAFILPCIWLVPRELVASTDGATS
ncbi:MAG TPA: hypothetical protein VGG10_07245 [Rhizomicrobium sp.]|jgi:MFS family permease